MGSGEYLPLYVILTTLTAEGRKTIKNKPERIKEVNKELETFGAKILQQYVVLGPYDFVNVVEAPDNETILRISIELGSRGTLSIISMPAMSTENLISRLPTSQTFQVTRKA
jgi:uncharacterized protein with GYD domain